MLDFQIGGLDEANQYPGIKEIPILTTVGILIYAVKIRDSDHPRDKRITATVAKIAPNMLQHSWIETECRFDVCRVTNAAHTEEAC
jgi:hypothetical protein